MLAFAPDSTAGWLFFVLSTQVATVKEGDPATNLYCLESVVYTPVPCITQCPNITESGTETCGTTYVDRSTLDQVPCERSDLARYKTRNHGTSMKTNNVLSVLLILLALVWYDISSFTPSSID